MAEAKSTSALKGAVTIKRSAEGGISYVAIDGQPVLGFKAHVASVSEGATSHDVLVLTIRMDKVTVIETGDGA